MGWFVMSKKKLLMIFIIILIIASIYLLYNFLHKYSVERNSNNNKANFTNVSSTATETPANISDGNIVSEESKEEEYTMLSPTFNQQIEYSKSFISPYVEFGYSRFAYETVMYLVTKCWYYRVEQNGDVYYYTREEKTYRNEYEYQKNLDNFNVTFIKKLDNSTLQTLSESIRKKIKNDSEDLPTNYFIRYIINNQPKQINVDNIDGLENMLK